MKLISLISQSVKQLYLSPLLTPHPIKMLHKLKKTSLLTGSFIKIYQFTLYWNSISDMSAVMTRICKYLFIALIYKKYFKNCIGYHNYFLKALIANGSLKTKSFWNKIWIGENFKWNYLITIVLYDDLFLI